jgi:carbonic anhydrase/acetyltransferase-like protein (isoleucine patch superfamily)
MVRMTQISFAGRSPWIDPSAFVAPGAVLIWYNVVLRGDMNRIRIGARSNVQDGSVIHVDPARPGGPDEGFPALIGDDVLIGHMAMVHGCTLHDRAFVGLGAIVMDGCEIGSDAMLAAGAMLTQGKTIPSGQLWAGRPAKYVRDLRPDDVARMHEGVAHYTALAKRHAAAIGG